MESDETFKFDCGLVALWSNCICWMDFIGYKTNEFSSATQILHNDEEFLK